MNPGYLWFCLGLPVGFGFASEGSKLSIRIENTVRFMSVVSQVVFLVWGRASAAWLIYRSLKFPLACFFTVFTSDPGFLVR